MICFGSEPRVASTMIWATIAEYLEDGNDLLKPFKPSLFGFVPGSFLIVRTLFWMYSSTIEEYLNLRGGYFHAYAKG